ncbi:MAG: hypothetical protein ACI4JV_07685 [Ruminiclostridium sp.]
MKSTYIKLIAASLVLSCTAALTACNSSSTSSAVSSDSGHIGDTTSVSEPSDTSTQSSETESKTDSSSDENKSNDENKSGETSTESTVTYEYVKDGKFTLANGNLSFKMPDGWKLASASLAYQFASDDEYSENKFNLVVSKTDSPIEDVTDEQMTATYKATMEDFKLVDFQHTEIAGKKAVYMQLTGMVSQVTKQTTITQYMIQSGEDAYCFSFTQSTDDETFPDLITGVIDSLEIK